VITTGMARGQSATQAARFGFLMAIPVTVGAGAREAFSFAGNGEGGGPEVLIGIVMAGLSGYLAISLLIKGLARTGLWPFSLYCLAAGTVALIWL